VKSELEKNREVWNKKNALRDALLMGFQKPIKYDYPIPEKSDVVYLIRKACNNVVISRKLKKKIQSLVMDRYESNTILADHLVNEQKFGNEFFFGYGTLHRWRFGEREKALQNIEKYISKEDIQDLHKIEEYIRKKMNRNFDSFKLHFAIRG